MIPQERIVGRSRVEDGVRPDAAVVQHGVPRVAPLVQRLPQLVHDEGIGIAVLVQEGQGQFGDEPPGEDAAGGGVSLAGLVGRCIGLRFRLGLLLSFSSVSGGLGLGLVLLAGQRIGHRPDKGLVPAVHHVEAQLQSEQHLSLLLLLTAQQSGQQLPHLLRPVQQLVCHAKRHGAGAVVRAPGRAGGEDGGQVRGDEADDGVAERPVVGHEGDGRVERVPEGDQLVPGGAPVAGFRQALGHLGEAAALEGDAEGVAVPPVGVAPDEHEVDQRRQLGRIEEVGAVVGAVSSSRVAIGSGGGGSVVRRPSPLHVRLEGRAHQALDVRVAPTSLARGVEMVDAGVEREAEGLHRFLEVEVHAGGDGRGGAAGGVVETEPGAGVSLGIRGGGSGASLGNGLEVRQRFGHLVPQRVDDGQQAGEGGGDQGRGRLGQHGQEAGGRGHRRCYPGRATHGGRRAGQDGGRHNFGDGRLFCLVPPAWMC